ncbi:clostripain-related cysteine peptidase [Sphingobacterium sp. R2]|uniref:clostripain-related cysteine peptidase n=1 Tax=Sphingobacterium sp. R2 TaxID=3112958 RepID=UPI00345DBBE3
MSRLYYLILIFLIFFSCGKNNEEQGDLNDYISIFYMSGNNNLRYDIENAIVKLQKGYTPIKGKKILVYIKNSDNFSYILEIRNSKMSSINSDTIKVYQNRNASDPSHLKEVLSDVKKLYPSTKYSLILSSHATAWYPPTTVKFKSFGLDQNQELEIRDFKNSLKDIKFEYIIFDACYMSSIEVLHEIRNSAKYVVASPSEVISYGFPYEKIANRLFGGVDDLKIICDEYVNYYESLEDKYKSANVALIDLSKIQKFTAYLKPLFIDHLAENISIKSVQQLVFDDNIDLEAYDFLDLIKASTIDIKKVKPKLEELVLYKRYTVAFNGKRVNNFCGLSIYYPFKNKKNIFYNNYYKSYSFYQDSGISQFYTNIL